MQKPIFNVVFSKSTAVLSVKCIKVEVLNNGAFLSAKLLMCDPILLGSSQGIVQHLVKKNMLICFAFESEMRRWKSISWLC